LRKTAVDDGAPLSASARAAPQARPGQGQRRHSAGVTSLA